MVLFAKRTQKSEARSRSRRRSGNVIIETVFTMMPLFALIFAFVDFGLLLFRWCTLQNAVREGCRYAITYQRSGALGQDASIAQAVQQYAMGVVNTTANPCTTSGGQTSGICVNYFAPTNLNTAIPVANGGNVPGNVVEVSVQGVSWAMLAPISGSFGAGVPFFRSSTPIRLSVYSSDILGGYPAGLNSVPR